MALDPVLGGGDVALAVAVLDGLATLVEAQADEAQDGAACLDPLVAWRAIEPVIVSPDDDRGVERERAR